MPVHIDVQLPPEQQQRILRHHGHVMDEDLVRLKALRVDQPRGLELANFEDDARGVKEDATIGSREKLARRMNQDDDEGKKKNNNNSKNKNRDLDKPSRQDAFVLFKL